MRRRRRGTHKWIVAVCLLTCANFLFWTAGYLSKSIWDAGAAQWQSARDFRFEPISNETFEALAASGLKVHVQETGAVSLSRE